ncbi:MAG: DUF721 domain-containing protein [Bdellovibrionales bacterium]|nr:DUF721 domain-containing protein [Bdellovibrionales bacterium]
MNQLKSVLKKILGSNAALRQGVQEARIIELWPEAVGAMIAKHARAAFMKERKVFIEVDSPVWRQELFTNKQMVLKKFNDLLTKEFGVSSKEAWVSDLFFLNPGSKPFQNDR